MNIYYIDEMSFTSKDFGNICDEWRKEIEEKNKKFKHLYEATERIEYERLRKRFEGQDE